MSAYPARRDGFSRYFQALIRVSDAPTTDIPGPVPVGIFARVLLTPDERVYICSADPTYYAAHMEYCAMFAPGEAPTDEQREAWDTLLNDGSAEPGDYFGAWDLVSNVRDCDGADGIRWRVLAVYQGEYADDREGAEEAREFASGNAYV